VVVVARAPNLDKIGSLPLEWGKKLGGAIMQLGFSALLCVAFALSVDAADAARIPVIFDTDIGDDIDDTWALMMVLAEPALDVKLICTAADDTPAKTRLVAKILEAIGRTDIPIGIGPKTSDLKLNQTQWLGDFTLANYSGTVHEDGVQAQIDIIKGSAVPVTLIVIGPQTNLQHLLERDPSVVENAKVVSMAGSIFFGYNGREGRQPEHNVKKDVDAAKAVFAAPWEIVLAPLDTCGTLVLDGARYQKVRDAENPRAKVLVENYDAWSHRHHHPAAASSVLFDTLAVYLAAHDALCEMETLNLIVDDSGNTVPDPAGRPVHCALRWKDKEAFLDLVVARIAEE
jgi:inosine-uridine nucleoside N-ribohydrolase